MMRKLALLACLFAVSFSGNALATSANTQAAPAKPQWIEILPTAKNSDPKATEIAGILLKDEIRLYAYPKTGFTLEATFFNAPNFPKNTFIIAKFDGIATCGTMGCMTYFLRRTDPTKNVWKIINTNNYNSIVTSDALLAREPAFYTKGTAKSSYRRYNALTGAYETGR